METIDKIKDMIAKGNTEKALELLVEFAKTNNSPHYDEVVLLSGQFKQWKRQANLGLQQSSTELRRIEMGMMNILQEKSKGSTTQSSAQHVTQTLSASSSSTTSSPPASSNKMMPVILGGFALIMVALGFLFTRDTHDHDSPNTETTATTNIQENQLKPDDKKIDNKSTKSNNQPKDKGTKSSGKTIDNQNGGKVSPPKNTDPGSSKNNGNTTPPPTKPAELPKINGRNVNFVSLTTNGSTTGYFRNTHDGHWDEIRADFSPVSKFKETDRDDYSVYLYDKSRDVRIQLDLYQKQCFYNAGNDPQSPLYQLSNPMTSVNGKYLSHVTYKTSNGNGTITMNPGTNKWVEINSDSGPSGFPFEEVGRDEWSVYITNNNGTSLAIDANLKQVKILNDNNEYQLLYNIINAY